MCSLPLVALILISSPQDAAAPRPPHLEPRLLLTPPDAFLLVSKLPPEEPAALASGQAAAPSAEPTQKDNAVKAVVPGLSPLGVDPAPYHVDPILHGAIVAGTFGLIAALEFDLKPTLRSGMACVVPTGGTRCRASDLNGLDRRVVGMYSDTWQGISDVTLATVLSGAVLGTMLQAMLSDSPTRGDDFLSDALVLSEAVGFGVLMTSSLKFVVRRARPANYNDAAPLDNNVDESLSFPSGHTAGVASAAFAFATTFWLRHPDSPWRWVFAASALAATGFTAFSRVAAGRHFPTDVVAGGLFGAGSGILVPLLHSWLGADEVSVGGQRLGLPSVGPIGSTGGQGVFWSSRF